MKAVRLPVLLLVMSCGPTGPDPNVRATGQPNPLDTILGDKVLHVDPPIIRSNNLDRLKGLPITLLEQSSLLYSTTKLNDTLWLLHQQKSYAEARSFTVLLKSKQGLIADLHIVHDHRVRSWSVSDNDILLFSDDAENHNTYWKKENNILVMDLDGAFRERWRYVPETASHPIRASCILARHPVTLRAEVITGCEICFSIVELVLDTNGKFLRAKEVDLYNSSRHLDEERLNGIFRARP